MPIIMHILCKPSFNCVYRIFYEIGPSSFKEDVLDITLRLNTLIFYHFGFLYHYHMCSVFYIIITVCFYVLLR